MDIISGGKMETFGLIALVILFCYSSYPNKVKKLERNLRKIKKLAMEKKNNKFNLCVRDIIYIRIICKLL